MKIGLYMGRKGKDHLIGLEGGGVNQLHAGGWVGGARIVK